MALSVGGPFAFGQAAKSILEVKNIPYSAIAQLPGQTNDELYEWTGFRNAPVAVYNDEAPRAGWFEILQLAERINPEPALIPADADERVQMYGICHEIFSENGFAWSCRLMLVAAMRTMGADTPAGQLGQVLGSRYGYSEASAATAPVRAGEVMRMLNRRLEAQEKRTSSYLVGVALSAADIYWATSALMIAPLPDEVCPLDAGSRASFEGLGDALNASQYPVLIEHRDMIYQRHLKLPLDF